MDTIFKIDSNLKTPKYQQVANSIITSIREGKLKKGDQVFSINEVSDAFFLSRDTVQKAYETLRKKGVILSVPGKGFYINRTDIATPYRILLLFNKISNYKKLVYNSFVKTMGEKALVDLKIYHFNAGIFEALITENLKEYDYFVIMPHFYENTDGAREVIQKIPIDKLLILDKDISYLNCDYAAVYQDFQYDIFNALEQAADLLAKYEKLILVKPILVPYPPEIALGFQSFSIRYGFRFQIIHEIDSYTLINKKEAYLVIEDTDLVNLIKGCRAKGYKIGQNVGILSCNETPLKEILLDGITVISTDHEKMGETAARLILENKKEKIKNPFRLIQRKSL